MDLREQLFKLTEIGIALSSERSVNNLLDLILAHARNFTSAEGGTLFTREGDKLRFQVTQNDVLSEKLGSGNTGRYLRDKTMAITKTSLSGYTATTGEVLNIPDAYAIPSSAEYHFNDEYDRKNNYRTRSLLVVPMKKPDGEVIGVLQLINARDANSQVVPFAEDNERLVVSLASQAAVALSNALLTLDLKQAYLDTIMRLAIAAEFRDTDTAVHIRRMSLYSEAIAAAMPGYTPAMVEQILYAAPMHDIGKIGVSDRILQKPGKLTDEEFAEMKKHTTIGAAILEGAEAPVLKLSHEIALAHHEKWDGSGYPYGKKAEDIPLSARIVAVADVFDALSSVRCYKPPFPFDKAVSMIEEGSGKHFDPACVEAFRKSMPRIKQIYAEYSDESGAKHKLTGAMPLLSR